MKRLGKATQTQTHTHTRAGWKGSQSFLRLRDIKFALVAAGIVTRVVSFSSVPPILARLPVGSPLWHNITSLQLAYLFEGYYESQALRQKLQEVHTAAQTICEVGGCNSGRVMDYIRAINHPLKAN